MSTYTDMRQNSDKPTDALLSQYQYNKRKLKISLEESIISRAQFAEIKELLGKEFNKGRQPELEEVFQSDISLSAQVFHPVLNKELFKYNQIIIKLAQQFSKNITIQQLKLQNKDNQLIRKSVAAQQQGFSNMLKMLTNEYLEGRQSNIDDTLLKSGFIKTEQLEFLHNSARHLKVKTQDRKFGEIAVKNQFTTQEIVNKALDDQTALYRKTSKNHIIGDILVEQQQITPEVRDEILIIQNRVLEEDWEETLKAAGESYIEEREKNALFGALIIKEKLLDERKVVEALKIQAREMADQKKPRWIGDILVENFGLPEKDRKRIVKKQMEYRIERINLKLGLNLSDAHIELFNEMKKYFLLTYSKERLEAYIKLLSPLPKAITKENIIIWLYNKKISYGRISSAVNDLTANKVKPGKRILLAKGDAPVPEKVTTEIHFDAGKNSAGSSGDMDVPFLVQKGTRLITLNKKKGKSGLNVNHCFVAPPLMRSRTILKGKNVIKNSSYVFFAACDGKPHLSEKSVLSVHSKISVIGDVTPADSPLIFDCDFDVQGTVQPGVVIQCRSLKTQTLKGEVRCSEGLTVMHETVNAKVISKGSVLLSSVEDSLVTGEKGIVVQLHAEDDPSGFNKIYDSVISSDDVLKIGNAKILSSVIRAKSKIILKKVTVGSKCKFIVGDCLETIACKTEIETLNSDIKKIDAKIKVLQKKSRELFATIEKKDIATIEEDIKILKKNTKTKADLDRIAELRLIKRQKEKQYETNTDEYGNIFIQNFNKTKAHQAQRIALEKERADIEKKILAFYKKDSEIPELDVRRAMLPAGTVIQFRYNKKMLDNDCEGFVFREELSQDTHGYEIRKYRW